MKISTTVQTLRPPTGPFDPCGPPAPTHPPPPNRGGGPRGEAPLFSSIIDKMIELENAVNW
jgi:hypothetical protein